MSRKDNEIVSRVVEKVLKDFDFEIDDVLEAKREEIEDAVKEGVMNSIDEEPPFIDWIEMVELDLAETRKNGNGDFISS